MGEDGDLVSDPEIVDPGLLQHQPGVAVFQMDKGFRAVDFRQGDPGGDFHVGLAAPVQEQMVGPQAESQGAVGKSGKMAGLGNADVRPDADVAAGHFAGKKIDGGIAEDFGHGHGGRGAIDLPGPAGLDDPALVHHHDVPAQHERLGRLGGGVDHDGLPAAENLLKLQPQLFPEFVVQIHQRLVQQQQFGVFHQGPGDGGALLLPAGKLRRQPVQQGVDAEHGRRLPDAPVDLGGIFAANFQGGGDIVVNGEGRVVDELLVDHGHAALAHRAAGDVLAVGQELAARGPVEPGHDPKEGGFSGQGAAENDVAGTRLEGEGDVLQMHFRTDEFIHLRKRHPHESDFPRLKFCSDISPNQVPGSAGPGKRHLGG